MQRLKTRNQFQAVLAGGTVARTAHFALHRAGLEVPAANPINPMLPPPLLFSVRAVWLGAMVPKRWAKRAVTRNTIKRQIYSVGRDFEASLPLSAHVVRLRSALDRTQFVSATSEALKTAVRLELQQLFERAAVPAAVLPVGGGGV